MINNRLIDDAIKDAFKGVQPKQGNLDDLLARLADLNVRVQKRMAPFVAAHGNTSINKNKFFVEMHKTFLDELTSNKLTYDELLFAFAYNATKIFIDQL